MAKRFINSKDVIKIGGRYGSRTVIKACEESSRYGGAMFIMLCDCGKYSVTRGNKILDFSGVTCHHHARNILTPEQLLEYGITEPAKQLYLKDDKIESSPVSNESPYCKWLNRCTDTFDMEIHINTIRQAIRKIEEEQFLKNKSAFLDRLKYMDRFIHMAFTMAVWQNRSDTIVAKFNSQKAVDFLLKSNDMWSRIALEVFSSDICIRYEESLLNE